MAQITLNASVIASLQNPKTGQKIVWDTKVRGLGVRLTKSAKTFIAESRVKGRTRRVSICAVGVLTVAEARRRAQQELGSMAADIDPNAAKAEARAKTITLQEAQVLYLSNHDLKQGTVSENRRLIACDFSDWLCKEIKNITPSMVVKRFDRISKRSPTVANHAFWVLRAVLNYALVVTKTDAGAITLPPNPCQRLTDLNRWHKSKARTSRLTEDQFPAFFDTLEQAGNPTFADYMELLVRTGLRRTEATCLRWSDLNMTAKTFTIPAERAKNGRALTLPMSTQIEALFLRRRETRSETVRVFGDAKRYDPRKSLLKLRQAISADITYHDLRRTFLSVAEEQAVPYGLLKKMGNHSAGNDVTLKHYVNTVEHETLRPYMQKVSDQIDRLGGIFNENLKFRDQIKRLQNICHELAEFDEISQEIEQLRLVAGRIERLADSSCFTAGKSP